MMSVAVGGEATARRRSRVLIVASLVSSLIMLDSNVVAVSLPVIGRSLAASFTDIQWMISAYVLTYAALLLAAGNFADLVGRRKAMLIGLAVFAVASAACGVAGSAVQLNLSRGVQGVGGALLLTASLAIIAHDFAGAERAGAFAFWGASLGIALAVGPIIGGAITNFLGWRWVFLVNLPVCVLLIGATLKVVMESRDDEAKKLDFSGIVTFSLGLGMLIWALIDGNNARWGSASIVIRLVVAVLLFGGFFVAELRQARPMVDFGLFRRRTFVGAVLAMMGYGASAAGLAITVAGNLLFWVVARGQLPHGVFVAGTLVAGYGAGLLNGQTVKVLGGAVPEDRAGMASGLASTTRFIGILVSVAGMGAVLSKVVHYRFGMAAMAAGLDAAGADAAAKRVTSGDLAGALSAVPADMQAQLHAAGLAAFADGFAAASLLAAIVAVVAGVLTFLLVRLEETAPSHGAAKGDMPCKLVDCRHPM